MQCVIKQQNFVYIIAAVLSILLSCWVNSHETLINPDAICYLQSAATVSQGLSKVMSLCDQSSWPFYPILIASLAGFTKVSYLQAAFILNGVFSMLTVLVFIRITAFFTINRRVLWLAAGVILFAHEFNYFKQEIIRDHGYWFFYLLSIFWLLHYFKTSQWIYALSWSASLVFATLFRIEGAVFMLFMPFLAWFDISQSILERFKSFLRLNMPLLLVAVAVFAIVITHPDASLGRLNELSTHFKLSHFYGAVVQHYITLADALGEHVLGRSIGDRYSIYFFMLVVWYITIVTSVLSLIYSILFVYAIAKRAMPSDRKAQLVLWGTIIINVAMTFIFLVENQFVSKRYVFALVIVLMLWVPFALEHLAAQWQQRKWPLIMALLLMVISGATSVLHLGHSKQYVRDAGSWLSQNVPKNESIYSNDYQVMYYSQHFDHDIFAKQKEFSDLHILQDGRWRQYDYIAIRLNKTTLISEAVLLKEIGSKPIIIFYSKSGKDQIRIYRGKK